MTAEPLCKIIEIPDSSLNEALVPANDNHELITLGRERLEAESVLAAHDYARSDISPSLLIAALCLVALAAFAFGAWNP